MISIILLVFAFVLCCLASYGVGAPATERHWRLGWAGMAFYFLSLILGNFAHVSVR
jgi:hypothetical protein